MALDSVEPVNSVESMLRRREEREAFLFQVGDAIRPLRDPSRILAETCRLLGTYLHVNRVAYAEIDGDVCTVLENYVDGVAPIVGHVLWADFAGTTLTEIDRDGMLIVNDTDSDP